MLMILDNIIYIEYRYKENIDEKCVDYEETEWEEISYKYYRLLSIYYIKS